MIEKNNLLLRVCNIAIKAGEEILKYYNDDIDVTHKDDSSPLTLSLIHISEPTRPY